MATVVIKAKDFVHENLVQDGQIKDRDVTTENGSIVKEWTIPVKYKTDSGTLANVEIDYPPLKCIRGVLAKTRSKYTQYQIAGTVPLYDENEPKRDEYVEFYENFAKKLNERILDIIVDNFEKMKLQTGPPSKGGIIPPEKKAMYRELAKVKYYSPFFVRQDKDNVEMEGVNPKTVLNLLDFREKNLFTCFTDIKKQPLKDPETGKKLLFQQQIDMLTDVGFHFIGRMSLRQINVGANAKRAACILKSAIVYNFVEAGTDENHQEDAPEELQNQFADSDLAKLMELKKLKSSKLAIEVAHSVKEGATSGTVFEGTKPTQKKKATVEDTNDDDDDDDAGSKSDSPIKIPRKPASKKPKSPPPELEADQSDSRCQTPEKSDQPEQEPEEPVSIPTFKIPSKVPKKK